MTGLHRASISFTSRPHECQVRVTRAGRVYQYRLAIPPTAAHGGALTAAAQGFVNDMESQALDRLDGVRRRFSEAFAPFAPVFEAALDGAELAVLTLDAHIEDDSMDDLLAVPWEALALGDGAGPLLGQRALLVRAGEFGARHTLPRATRTPSAYRVVAVDQGKCDETDDVRELHDRPIYASAGSAFDWGKVPHGPDEGLYLHLAGKRVRNASALIGGAEGLRTDRLAAGLDATVGTLLVANTCASFYALGGRLHSSQMLRSHGGACAWPAAVPGLTLVATMWSVQAAAAASWGRDVFGHLRQGKSVAEAVLNARRCDDQDERRSRLAYSVHGDADLIPFR